MFAFCTAYMINYNSLVVLVIFVILHIINESRCYLCTMYNYVCTIFKYIIYLYGIYNKIYLYYGL